MLQFYSFLVGESINDADLITLKPYNLFNVNSTKINRLLQEEINATLMCHL